MAQKTITIPESVTICDPLTDEPLKKDGAEWKVSFKEFVLNTLLADQLFNKSWEAVSAAIETKKQVKAHAPGETFDLAGEDFAFLHNAATKPSNGYVGWMPSGTPQLAPFIRAIVDAEGSKK